MKIVLFDNSRRHLLYPFTYTKPVAALLFGMYNNLIRWQKATGLETYALTESYLQPGWELPTNEEVLLIDASVMPDAALMNAIFQLQAGQSLLYKGELIAGSVKQFQKQAITRDFFLKHDDYTQAITQLTYPWHIFQNNAAMILADYHTLELNSRTPSTSNSITNLSNVWLGEHVKMEHCIINASAGPVIIGDNTTVLEGSLIYGPFVAGQNTVIKAGARIYGGSIGNYCTVGGEVKNSVIMHYSNKAHDGYLGDAVVGEWCNLGAGTSNSNVKNDASNIIMEIEGKKINVGLKCGLLMGDYSRSAINTSFNTGTIVGVSSSVFGAGLTPKKLPNFTWGFSERYQLERAKKHINNWKVLKQQSLTTYEAQVLDYLYEKL